MAILLIFLILLPYMLQVHYLLSESWILMFKQTDSGSWLLGMFIPDVNMQNVFNLQRALQ